MINYDYFEPYVGEPDINRLKRAFMRDEVDRVPNLEVLIEDEHVKSMLGRYAGNTLAYGGDPAKGEIDSTNIRPMYPKDYVEICNIIGQDTLVIEAIWTPFKKESSSGKVLPVTDRSVKNLDDFNSLIYPSDKDIEEKLFYVRVYKEAVKGTKIGVTVAFGSMFQTLYEFIVGMADFMVMCYENVDAVHYMMEVSAEYWTKFCKAIVEEGVDFIYVGDDVAFKSGLFLPPKLFSELWKDRYARIIEPGVSKGLPVLFHSDGKIDEIVPWLIDMGVSCINPMDPYSIDYREYKRRFGKNIALMGNIDIEFPLAKGTPADVENDVKEHMEVLKPGYGYVCSSSHSIVNYIPHENFVAMINAIHRYGVYCEDIV